MARWPETPDPWIGAPPAPGSVPAPPPAAVPPPAPALRHPGLIRRTIAFGLDLVVLVPLSMVVLPWLFGHLDGYLLQLPVYDAEGKVLARTLADLALLHDLATLFFPAAWFTFFESRFWQASPGKLFVGISVTDTEGRACGLVRVFVRNLGKYLTIASLGLGMLPALVGPRSRALHDLLSGTMPIRSV